MNPTITIKDQLFVVNDFGELVRAKMVPKKSYGIFWETVTGEWIKKVHAIRDNIALTGRSRRMEVEPVYVVMRA